ncbi:MAG: GumC family protein, partial [Chitinophagales bacterium]
MQSIDIKEQQSIREKAELGNLSVKDLFFKYIRFLPVFLLSLAVTLFAAWIYLRYATPIFRASGTLEIKEDKQSGGGTDDPRLNQLVLNTETQNIQNEIEVLKSKPLMERVVNALNLQVNYKAIGKIKSPDIYKQGPLLLQVFDLSDSSRPFTLDVKFLNDTIFTINDEKRNFSFGELFKNEYGVFRLNKNSYSSPGKEYMISWQPTGNITAALAGIVQVTPIAGTDILNISIETTNSHKSSDIINQLMVEYGEMTKEDKNAEAALTLIFVDTSLKSVQHEIDSIQKQKTAFQKANNLIDLQSQTQNYLSDVSEADRSLRDQEILMNVTEIIENYLKDKQNNYKTVPSSLGLTDLTLAKKIDDYNTAQLYRKGLVESHIPENNPLVKEQNAIIEQLRTDILEAMKNIKISTAVSIDTYKQRENSVQGQIKALPPQISKLNEFQTELDSKMGIYTYLMEKKLATTISQASTLSNSKIIEKSIPSSNPVKPNRRTVQLLAILAGIGIPALFIFMLEVVNDKVTTRFDIEKMTQAPILGEVGH